MSPSQMRSRHLPRVGRIPRAFWAERVHCSTSLPCCLRARLERGSAPCSVSVCGLFPSPTVMPVGSGFGGGATTAGAALLELAAEALSVGARAPDAGVAEVNAGAGGT
eukprot:11615980-Alexandrium_andersonii.AAC.1